MILQALTAYYEQLLRTGQISAPGWENQFKVSYWLRINAEGQLIDLVDCRQMVPRGKKEVLAPREMAVPAHVKRASGIAANFLCDNSTYLLGADEKGKPERSIQCFEACAKLHHAILDGVDSPAARAVLAFFDHWKPKKHRPTRYWLTAGRISPETPTFCSTMKGRRAASCPLKMKRSERHGSSTTAALRPTLRWSSVS